VAPLTIAIDGPASSGKGTVARGVARRLGYGYVDTGAMYRSVAWAARERGVAWQDAAALGTLAASLRFRFAWEGDILRVFVDGQDVTSVIRQDELGLGASEVSRHPEVRTALLGRQRELGAEGGVVMDGRDIGTVVLPNAGLKIYLDAALDVRALRRHEELLRRGEAVSYETVRAAMMARDRQDMGRAVAPLKPADDAVIVDSSHKSALDVIEEVLVIAAERGA